MRIVVNTPPGNIGRIITQQLLEAGEDVVIISRPAKGMDLVERGSHLVEGSIDDANSLDSALKGADELFC